MKLTKITLENFRRFKRLEIPLEDCQQVIFIGNNGAGKTSVLEAVAKGLSWLVARINWEKGSGSPIDDAEILNGQAEATIALNVEHQGNSYEWFLAKSGKGRQRIQRRSILTGATTLANHFRTILTTNAEQASLSLILITSFRKVLLQIVIWTLTIWQAPALVRTIAMIKREVILCLSLLTCLNVNQNCVFPVPER